MESISIAVNLEAPCFSQNNTVWAGSVRAWPSMCSSWAALCPTLTLQSLPAAPNIVPLLPAPPQLWSLSLAFRGLGDLKSPVDKKKKLSVLRQLRRWQLCFWFSGSCCPSHCNYLSDECHLFSSGDWIAVMRSELFRLYYCHSIKSLASPSSIIYLRLFTNLHLLLNPVLAFCLDASPTNILQLLFISILLSWIAVQ